MVCKADLAREPHLIICPLEGTLPITFRRQIEPLVNLVRTTAWGNDEPDVRNPVRRGLAAPRQRVYFNANFP